VEQRSFDPYLFRWKGTITQGYDRKTTINSRKSAGMESHKGSIFSTLGCHLPTLVMAMFLTSTCVLSWQSSRYLVSDFSEMDAFQTDLSQNWGPCFTQTSSSPHQYGASLTNCLHNAPPGVVHLQCRMRGMLGQLHVIGCLAVNKLEEPPVFEVWSNDIDSSIWIKANLG